MKVTEIKGVASVSLINSEIGVISTVNGAKGIVSLEDGSVFDIQPCELLLETTDGFITRDDKETFRASNGEVVPICIMYAGQEGQYVFHAKGVSKMKNPEENVGVCNSDFSIVIPAEYERIYSKVGGYLVKCHNGKWKLLDASGTVRDGDFDSVNLSTLNQDSLCVFKNGEWYILDSSMKRITKGEYSYLQNFNSIGMAIFKKDGLYGLIDKNEKVVMSTKHLIRWCNHDTLVFSSTMLDDGCNRDTAKWGLMDTCGNILLEEKFRNYTYWPSKGYIRLTDENGRKGYVNSMGGIIVPFMYDWVSYFHELNIFTIRINGKNGILDGSGQEIIPPIYDSLSVNPKLGLNMISVTKDGRAYFINSKQEEVNL